MEAKALLSRLIHAFSAPKPDPLPEPDEKLALGALMVRVAMSDHDYRVDEISRIDRLLSRLYGLNPVEAAKMRAEAAALEATMPKQDYGFQAPQGRRISRKKTVFKKTTR